MREAIREGALRPGVRLPSSRRLAQQLGVSRGVTSDAYGQLEAQGYIVMSERSAPVVAEVPVHISQEIAAAQPLPRAPRYDMSASTPDITLFPSRDWLGAVTHTLRSLPARALEYGEPRGELELRTTLADHLGRTRGVIADPGQIIITQGARQGTDVLLRVLRARGARRIGLEDPSQNSPRDQMPILGLEPVGCPVDDAGIVIGDLDAAAVIVTPAHQFPIGVVLSGERRREVLAWARRHEALVIEDDYDAEFRYDREPVRAMQGLDPEHVAYLGTLSKTFAPAFRLGWLVVPAQLVEEAAEAKRVLDSSSPRLDQLTLAHFIARGDYDRHVRRVRGVYQARRDRLTASLARHLPDLPVSGVTAGLHVTIRLPAGMDDTAVATHAERLGIAVTALSTLAMDTSAPGGLLIGYGRIHQSAIDRGVATLAKAVYADGRRAARPGRPR